MGMRRTVRGILYKVRSSVFRFQSDSGEVVVAVHDIGD